MADTYEPRHELPPRICIRAGLEPSAVTPWCGQQQANVATAYSVMVSGRHPIPKPGQQRICKPGYKIQCRWMARAWQSGNRRATNANDGTDAPNAVGCLISLKASLWNV